MIKKKFVVSSLLLLSFCVAKSVLVETGMPESGAVSQSEQQQIQKQAQADGINQETVQQQDNRAQIETKDKVTKAAAKEKNADIPSLTGEDESGSYYLPDGTEHSDRDQSETAALDSFDLELLELPTVSAANANLPSKSFVDVSSHNGNISADAFRKMRAYGVRGVVVKLTEGDFYQNPYAAAQIANAKSAGLKVSAYHYSWFTSDASARKEANYFANFASQLGLPKSTVMVNDIEAPDIRNRGNHTNDSASFTDQLHRLGFGNVRHYASYGWVRDGLLNGNQLGNKNIWVAAYHYTLSTQNCYTAYGAWQWSSLVTFPGVSGTFDLSADYTGIFKAPEPANPAPSPVGTNAMYRLYNPNSGEHFYTRDNNEKNSLIQSGWRYEGVAWNAPQTGNPVYRMYNPNAGDHHYTLNGAERDSLKRAGWHYEGISWYSGGNQALYRLYNPNAKTGTHHYTLNTNERDQLRQVGWRYEGISWYGK